MVSVPVKKSNVAIQLTPKLQNVAADEAALIRARYEILRAAAFTQTTIGERLSLRHTNVLRDNELSELGSHWSGAGRVVRVGNLRQIVVLAR